MGASKKRTREVSVPYEITLLSNFTLRFFGNTLVSVPYEITLLSNLSESSNHSLHVSVPYEITLLSNAFVDHYI